MHKKQAFIAIIVGLTALLLWLSSNSWAQPRQLWEFPLSPVPAIARGFDPPKHDWLPGHRGVDLRAHTGQPVLAPESGTISYVSELAGRGVVVIKHGQLRSTYEPVTSQLTIGEHVKRGDKIGRVECGTSHCCVGTQAKCLHWGLLRGTQYLNPLGKVDLHIRLLPIEPVLPRLAIPKKSELKDARASKREGKISAKDVTTPADVLARKPNATDPSKHAYKVAWLPNWHGQGSLALL